MLGLGGHSKEAGDEGDLPSEVSLVHCVHLSFANHVHGLLSLQGALCTLERKEAQPRLDSSFDQTMVLLHQVIEIVDLPEFDGSVADGGDRLAPRPNASHLAPPQALPL